MNQHKLFIVAATLIVVVAASFKPVYVAATNALTRNLQAQSERDMKMISEMSARPAKAK